MYKNNNNSKNNKNSTKSERNTFYRAGAVLAALVIWHLASVSVGSEMLLVSPLQVAARLVTMCTEEGFFSTVLYSFLRVAAGFLSAVVAGMILATAAGRWSFIEYLLRPYVVTIKSVPVASFIILCLIWFSFSLLTAFISFLIAFPVIYTNVLQGIKSADGGLTEMAELYRVPWARKFLYIYIPSIKPYLLSACGVAAGMAWKAGMAAEVIGVVRGSIGEKLYESKIYFMNADLLAWTVIIIILGAVSEKLVLFLFNRLFSALEKL